MLVQLFVVLLSLGYLVDDLLAVAAHFEGLELRNAVIIRIYLHLGGIVIHSLAASVAANR
jgi:hypothetical protein